MRTVVTLGEVAPYGAIDVIVSSVCIGDLRESRKSIQAILALHWPSSFLMPWSWGLAVISKCGNGYRGQCKGREKGAGVSCNELGIRGIARKPRERCMVLAWPFPMPIIRLETASNRIPSVRCSRIDCLILSIDSALGYFWTLGLDFATVFSIPAAQFFGHLGWFSVFVVE
ncbi:hypothetical protein Tco_1078520 [Tanacetum coccineum]|uniref:Uncharacterized protein n=1 Tax=Tanacetum coccineum TaxID=301880 RepID=A0ABQ5HPT8_9ASTR